MDEIESLQSCNYVLLDQSYVEDPIVGDIYDVTELYGYAPNTPFTWLEYDFVTLPGISGQYSSVSYDYTNGLRNFRKRPRLYHKAQFRAPFHGEPV